MINTRTPNVEKTLPYYHAVLHVFVVFMFMKFITISKLKFFLLFSYYLLVILLLDDYDHEKYWWFLFILTAILLLILHLHKKDNDILQQYLEKLQQKFDEEHGWKQLLDDLQEGIILIDKDFQILYKNKTICTIFGLKEETQES